METVSSSVKSEVFNDFFCLSLPFEEKGMLIYLHFRHIMGGNLLKVCKLFSFIIFKQCYLAEMRALFNNCNHGLEFIIAFV